MTHYIVLDRNFRSNICKNIFKVGMNVYNGQFINQGSSMPGGFYVVTPDEVPRVAVGVDYIALCIIPHDAQTHQEPYKLKVSKVFITDIIPIGEWPLWQDEAFIQRGIKIRPDIISFVKNPSEELLITAVRASRHVLQYMKNTSDTIYLEAIKKDPWAIIYVPEERKTSEMVQLGRPARPTFHFASANPDLNPFPGALQPAGMHVGPNHPVFGGSGLGPRHDPIHPLGNGEPDFDELAPPRNGQVPDPRI
jgi:hypothetical protein